LSGLGILVENQVARGTWVYFCPVFHLSIHLSCSSTTSCGKFKFRKGVNSTMIHCKNFCEWHNEPPAQK
jgi:hypothetical protein